MNDNNRKNIRKRVCRSCGISFDGGPRAWYCPNCREERRKQQNKEYHERKKRGNTRTIGNKYPCEICGKEFVLASGLQRYCTDCAKIHFKEVDNKQSKEWNNSHPNEMKIYKENEKIRYQKIKNELEVSSKAKSKNIAKLREEKNISKHRLSVLIGMDVKTVSYIEKLNDLSNVKLGTLEKIAFALDMSLTDFFYLLYKE